MTRVLVIFYSMYGHIYKMSEAVVAGAKAVKDTKVELYRVAELVPDAVLEKSGAKAAQKVFEHVPIIQTDQMPDADVYLFGTPTRFGNMCAQMRNFMDQLGGLWSKNTFVGKVGSVYTSTGTQHGGQETTLTSTHTTLLHLGMVIVGMPYSEKRQTTITEISGGSPYGATTIAGSEGKRQPSENELAMAHFQGKHAAEIGKYLKLGRDR